MNRDIPNGLIEDQAALALRDGASVESATNLSHAISLKRIADVLAAGELPGGLYSQITQLAWEAGQNLGRGFDVGRSI